MLLVLAAPPSGADASQPAIEVRASAAVPAIKRILAADHLDIDRLSSAEIAGRMEAIPRGAAPVAFWQAYQKHVAAWRTYADAEARSRAGEPGDVEAEFRAAAVATARLRINQSFDAVEIIARSYGITPPSRSR